MPIFRQKNIQNWVFNFQRIVINTIQYDVKHPTLGDQHPTFAIKHPTLEVKHPTLGDQHPTFGIKHPTFAIKHPTLGDQHPMLDLKHPMLGGKWVIRRHLTSESENIRPENPITSDREIRKHLTKQSGLSGQRIRSQKTDESDNLWPENPETPDR